ALDQKAGDADGGGEMQGRRVVGSARHGEGGRLVEQRGELDDVAQRRRLPCADARPAREQQLDNRRHAARGGDEERGPPVVAVTRRIGIGAGIEEQAHDVDALVLDGDVERSGRVTRARCGEQLVECWHGARNVERWRGTAALNRDARGSKLTRRGASGNAGYVAGSTHHANAALDSAPALAHRNVTLALTGNVLWLQTTRCRCSKARSTSSSSRR